MTNESVKRYCTCGDRTCRLGNSRAEAALLCPKCDSRMEPMLLGMEDEMQNVWWTCSAVKTKKCTFPLDLPSEVFWVKRTKREIDANNVPPPSLDKLPAKFHFLYPSIFSAGRYHSRQDSRQTSLDSNSSAESGGSASTLDVEEVNKLEAARRLMSLPTQKMRLRRGAHTGIVPSTEEDWIDQMAKTAHTQDKMLRTRIFFGSQQDQGTRMNLISNGFRSNKSCAKEDIKNALASVTDRPIPRSGRVYDVANLEKVNIHAEERRRERKRRAEEEAAESPSDASVDTSSIDAIIKAKLTKNKRMYRSMRRERADEQQAAEWPFMETRGETTAVTSSSLQSDSRSRCPSTGDEGQFSDVLRDIGSVAFDYSLDDFGINDFPDLTAHY